MYECVLAARERSTAAIDKARCGDVLQKARLTRKRNLRLDGGGPTEDLLFRTPQSFGLEGLECLTGPVSFPGSTPAFAGFRAAPFLAFASAVLGSFFPSKAERALTSGLLATARVRSVFWCAIESLRPPHDGRVPRRLEGRVKPENRLRLR